MVRGLRGLEVDSKEVMSPVRVVWTVLVPEMHTIKSCVLYSTYLNVHVTIQGRRWKATAIWQVSNRGLSVEIYTCGMYC